MNLETNWMSKSELKDYLGFSMGENRNDDEIKSTTLL